MNLLFKKDKSQSNLFIIKDGTAENFDYIKMMKYLIAGDNLEDSKFEGDYSGEEILKVNEMINKINETILNGQGRQEEIVSLPDDLFSESIKTDVVEDEIKVENIPF